jgi:hypothetical protein
LPRPPLPIGTAASRGVALAAWLAELLGCQAAREGAELRAALRVWLVAPDAAPVVSLDDASADSGSLVSVMRQFAGKVSQGANLTYLQVISDCHFRKIGTEYDRKPGVKLLSCTEK